MPRLAPFFQLLLLLFVVFAMLRSEANQGSANLVRVRLEKSQRQFQFAAQSLKLQGKESWQFASLPSKADYGVTRKGLLWTITRPFPQKSEIVTGKVLWIEAQRLEKNQRLLPNRILLIPKGDSQFDVIGVVPLETYLVGVVSGEMPQSWPLEALKAQAVAARSYALAVIKERRHKEFHLESSIMDQVFKAMTLNEWQSSNMKRVIQAVKETEGVFISDLKNIPVKAFYHSHCGGETSDSKSVWGQKDILRPVLDESCASSRSGAWTASFELTELAEKVIARFPQFQSQILVAVVPERNGILKRASRIQLKWSGGASTWVSGNEFRGLIGYEKLLSTNFEIVSSGSSLIFRGFGRGHGVGMCQYGTKALADQSKTYQEILTHYFPMVKISRSGTRFL